MTLAATSDNNAPAAAAPSQPSAWDLEQEATGADENEIGVDATSEPTPGPTPARSDIKLSPKVTEKQCFGSAGCSLDIKVEMAYDGPTLSSDDTWEVTYEITGDESGPIIGTLEVTGEQYTVQKESMTTKGKDTKISLEVTDIEKAGF